MNNIVVEPEALKEVIPTINQAMTVHMASALAGCRTALVGTGWTISRLVSANGNRNKYSPHCSATISGSVVGDH